MSVFFIGQLSRTLFRLSLIVIIMHFEIFSKASFSNGSSHCKIRRNIVLSMSTVPSGLVAAFKPQGWTSSDVVMKFRNILQSETSRITGKKCKIKVGHGGTLDPLAQGVLILGVGKGTTLMESYLAGSKGYRAIARLGSETDTLDSTGVVREETSYDHVTLATLQDAMPAFRGDILQVPPMYSALKRDGKKLYDLARQGLEVEREARPVTVYSLELQTSADSFGTMPLFPEFGLDIECSGGFYVRTVIADLARACHTRGHMTQLLRTKQGPFTVDDCITQDRWNFREICDHIVRSSDLAGIDSASLPPAAS